MSFVGPLKKKPVRGGAICALLPKTPVRGGAICWTPRKTPVRVVSFGPNWRPGLETGTGPGGLTCALNVDVDVDISISGRFFFLEI